MYIYGSFINQQGDMVTVHIVTNADRSETIEIGTDGAGLYFTDDPVEITSEVNDTFDHLLRQSASVRLLARSFMPGFFCTSCRDAVVNICRGGTCLFAGFIEPQTYSQPYNEVLDEVELNCIDALSALQYSKYANVGSAGVAYAFVKADAEQRTFHDIITDILDGIAASLDISAGQSVRYLYDGSKAVDERGGNRYSVFKQIAISELLFLGDEEDDVWQQDEVLEEVMRYLNLHVLQDGLTFYIFSWETVKGGDAISWRNIVNGQLATTTRKTVATDNALAADSDATVSIGEVFNQLLLTCRVEKMENVIESPLDDDLLTPVYSRYQKYCTEYSSDGEGERAYKAFFAMTHGKDTDWGCAVITDWLIRVMANGAWRFPVEGDTSTDLVAMLCKDKTDQHALPNWLATHRGAAVIALGSVETNMAKTDNSPTSKVDMTNALVISVNGNGIADDETRYRPDDDDIKASIPVAVYEGNQAGGVFSPADDDTTNYIVISGKVVLNPNMGMTAPYTALHNDTSWDGNWSLDGMKYFHHTVPSRDNKDGRYYTRQYWQAKTPLEAPVWYEGLDYGFTPFTGKGPEEYEFKHSAVGDGIEGKDMVSKVAVLACMLIIGDKCVCEKTPQNDWGTGEAYSGHGLPEDFVWKKYKTREQCSGDDEYYQQMFTIGFDPKIGDKLIGTEFDLQTNFSYERGIEADGIAIPIRKPDKVSGRVKFMILGPVNLVWDEITRRHPTFFRHTKWTTASKFLLARVSSIMIKQFEVKVYSDNGLTDGSDDGDLVYMSDTREDFTNRKDDLEFKITTALTAAECKTLGVADSVKMSAPVAVPTGDALLSVYDRATATQAKPEQIYVDSYYREYHLPRTQMQLSILDRGDNATPFNHYVHPAMPGKTFFVQALSRNLMEGSAQLNLKETDR